jgi:hypothetical protein
VNYKEEQRFSQWWLWILSIGIGVILVYGIYKQIILGQPIGDKPISNISLILFSIFMFIVLSFLWLLKLTTVIDSDSITINFFPILNKKIYWSDIKSFQVVDYGFVGGWGIRLWTKYGTVYNTKGKKGLALELKNGKKYCIGTQKENALKEFLKEIGK